MPTLTLFVFYSNRVAKMGPFCTDGSERGGRGERRVSSLHYEVLYEVILKKFRRFRNPISVAEPGYWFFYFKLVHSCLYPQLNIIKSPTVFMKKGYHSIDCDLAAWCPCDVSSLWQSCGISYYLFQYAHILCIQHGFIYNNNFFN